MKTPVDTTKAKPAKPTAEPKPVLCKYEVLCEKLKLGGALCYRTAQVNLTAEHAAAINAAQPGSVQFLGI